MQEQAYQSHMGPAGSNMVVTPYEGTPAPRGANQVPSGHVNSLQCCNRLTATAAISASTSLEPPTLGSSTVEQSGRPVTPYKVCRDKIWGERVLLRHPLCCPIALHLLTSTTNGDASMCSLLIEFVDIWNTFTYI
jgi:hypothetical protein